MLIQSKIKFAYFWHSHETPGIDEGGCMIVLFQKTSNEWTSCNKNFFMCTWWLFIIIRQGNITKLLIKSDQAPSLNPKHEGWPYLTHCDNKDSSQALLGKMVRFMFKMLLNIWCDIIWIFFMASNHSNFL